VPQKVRPFQCKWECPRGVVAGWKGSGPPPATAHKAVLSRRQRPTERQHKTEMKLIKRFGSNRFSSFHAEMNFAVQLGSARFSLLALGSQLSAIKVETTYKLWPPDPPLCWPAINLIENQTVCLWQSICNCTCAHEHEYEYLCLLSQGAAIWSCTRVLVTFTKFDLAVLLKFNCNCGKDVPGAGQYRTGAGAEPKEHLGTRETNAI